jgi:N-acetylneuraminic acid mutarotase
MRRRTRPGDMQPRLPHRTVGARHWPLLAALLVLVLATLLVPGLNGQPRLLAMNSSGLGMWTRTGSMTTARVYHTDVLLPTGRVLVIGGVAASGSILSSVELYDPRQGRWTKTVSMGKARAGVTAVLLLSGHILVAGGASGTAGPGPMLASAELYDPGRGRWTATGAMTTARYDYTATVLPNGQVLIAGGVNTAGVTLATAELYNPQTGQWTATGRMTTSRAADTATLLPSGRVLVMGGAGGMFGSGPVLRSAEIYDPRTGRWTATGQMSVARASHTATELSNGQVLVAGGESGQSDGDRVLASAEVYDPRTGRWTVTGAMTQSRYNHTATRLPDGTILVAGGQEESVAGHALSNTERYEPQTGTWTATAGMTAARTGHTATLLPNGLVLVAGGNALTTVGPTEVSTELFDPHARHSGLIDTSKARAQFTATLLSNGLVLVTGGVYAPPSLLSRSSAELYNPRRGTWAVTGSMSEARASQTATLLPNGRVLVVGGFNSTGILASVEVYNPQTGAWTATGRLHTARAYQTATLLPDGSVLVAGGLSTTGATLSSAEVYTPRTGAWRVTPPMRTACASHTATLLPTGRVLVAGGVSGKADRVLASAEVYDPHSGRWARTGSMRATRAGHTATLLPTGQVLIAGGKQDVAPGVVLASAELYTPRTGAWTAAGSMRRERVTHTATLLPNGRVLVTGGEDTQGANFNSTELYTPHTNGWTIARGSGAAHAYHVATLLPDGAVLIAGGVVVGANVLSFAEVYDPRTGRWRTTDSM